MSSNYLAGNALGTSITSEVIDRCVIRRNHVHPTTPHEETTMESTARLIDSYLSAYGEPNRDARAKLVRDIWNPQGRLIDPPMSAKGHDEIVAQADALLSLYPDHRFCRSSAIDEHHGFAKYDWELLNAQGVIVLRGTDFATIDDDGKLACVVGFFGSAAPGAASA